MTDPMSIPVVGPILEKISSMIVAALFSHLNYVFCSKSLVEDLKSENEKLEIVENRMSRKAEEESNNGRILEKHVVDWKKEARENQESVKSCLEKYDNRPSGRCFGFLPIPHPLSRYRLGKEAEKMAKITTSLTTSGDRHLANPIAYLPLDMNAPETEFHEFKSREEAYQKLEGLVTDDSSSILGINGIAGAGKTRLMERITTEAGKKGTFHKFVRANVGNGKLDVIGIQQQLAGNLGCDFKSTTDSGLRANQLRSSLRQGGKVLVILDDVWRVIPLETIGILSADGMSSIGGKILFTSRSEEVCKLNKCEQPVKLKPLTFAETWDMFSKTVGADTIDSLQNISVAKDICKRCGGLPLVILALGNALKYKPLDSWKDARNQLKNSKIEGVSGIREDVDVYACLKLSFDHLEKDAKACLLLSSMYPEDADIPIRELVQLTRGSEQLVGSQLMKGDEIRTRVHSMIYILKSASLLLQGLNSEHIKLHDIIRDMARSIAIKDHGFLFATTSGSLPNNPAEYSALKVLHIDVEETHSGFPSNVACPDLHTLSLRSSTYRDPTTLQGWISQIQVFANLRFLVLVEFSWPEKCSLESLDNLKTLWFVNCNLFCFGEREAKFLPEKLEDLCCWDCDIPKQLNLPELNHLRKLEIYINTRSWLWARGINVEQNTISRLSSLEELSLPSKFYINKEGAKDGSLPILDEVSELPCLTNLHIRSQESKSSKLATTFLNLREFHLFVGDELPRKWSTKVSPVTKSIKLSSYAAIEGYRTLIDKAEEVILSRAYITGNSICNRNTQEFINLRYMKIKACHAIEYLARISPGDKIQESLHQSIPFSNLIKLKIKSCYSLKYLFCDSFGRCLHQLKELEIVSCPEIEQVVLGEGASDGNIIHMSKLKIMILTDLPRLLHFYKDARQNQPLFNQMVEFPSLEELVIRGLSDITDIWGDNKIYENTSSFSQLKILTVRGCNKLKNVIPPSMLRGALTSEVDTLGSNTDSFTGRASQGHVKAMLSHNPKKKLQILLKKIVRVSRYVCRKTPTITEENLNDPYDISVQVPPQNTRVCPLVQMTLQVLPCLEKTGLNFEDQSGAVSLYPNLKRLDIYECDRLENVFIPFNDTHCMNLEEMSVANCIKMCEIIGAGKQKYSSGIVFHKLRSLTLRDLLRLTSFWGCRSGEANHYKVEFPNLKTLHLHCGENPSLLEMIESGRDDSTFQLENLAISCGKEIKIPKQWLLQLDNLESLSLHRCWSDELKSLRFQRLKKLTLGQLSCFTVFSFPDFERLQQLRELRIAHCDSLEHIVEVVNGEEASGMDTETAALVQLVKVYLEGLPKLRSFTHTKSKNLMASLEQVEVEPSILFRCPVVGNLQQLRWLDVTDCRLLEGIVEVARGYQTSHRNDHIITFPQLYSIKLRNLPNLQNFSPTKSYSFKMPKLTGFGLFYCPRMENKPFMQIIAERVHFSSEERRRLIIVENLKDYTLRKINKLESVGESSNSNQDVETETMRVEQAEAIVVQQREEGVGAEEDDFFFLRKSQTSLFFILFLFLVLVLCLKEV
ncbi:hypothetical protein DCAR_0309905 [Daucus carota subsp. sativus]|nr:PREDICTED: probable disease resistance protein At4g27220 [Daucus carota subsp. sativus]WOG90661.1 hypothetical protein DCAR_0309905 [Daucus carota subsp. sativus]